MVASDKGCLRDVETLLAAGADVNAEGFVSYRKWMGDFYCICMS